MVLRGCECAFKEVTWHFRKCATDKKSNEDLPKQSGTISRDDDPPGCRRRHNTHRETWVRIAQFEQRRKHMKALQKHTLLALALAVAFDGSLRASVLWDGDATHGTGVFGTLNIEDNPGEVNVVTDGTYGKVFQMICYDNAGTKTRTEGSHMANFQPVPGSTYYFGWRHKWGPLPTLCGKWQVIEQIHTTASGGPVPFGLHVDGCDPNMHWQYESPAGVAADFLVKPFPLNSWHTFVYHEKWSTSETDGYVEVWYDGTMQTLLNSSTRYPAAWCISGSDSYWKWGIYRSGSGGAIGTAYAYLGQAKAGTTFADVDPGGTVHGTTVSFEAENLAVSNSGVGTSVQSDVNSSNGQWIELVGTGTAQWMEFTTGTVQAGPYSVSMMWKGNTTRGITDLYVDGTKVGGTLDQYSSAQSYPTTTFGTVTFASAGTHKIRMHVTGKNASSTGYQLSADKFTFTAQ
jgi:hypothetical protein